MLVITLEILKCETDNELRSRAGRIFSTLHVVYSVGNAVYFNMRCLNRVALWKIVL